jgi:hypothetical protein
MSLVENERKKRLSVSQLMVEDMIDFKTFLVTSLGRGGTIPYTLIEKWIR